MPEADIYTLILPVTAIAAENLAAQITRRRAIRNFEREAGREAIELTQFGEIFRGVAQERKPIDVVEQYLKDINKPQGRQHQLIAELHLGIATALYERFSTMFQRFRNIETAYSVACFAATTLLIQNKDFVTAAATASMGLAFALGGIRNQIDLVRANRTYENAIDELTN